MKPAYKYPAIACAALALFIISLFVLISGNDVEKILKAELQEKSGISFTSKDFSKSFPLGFTAKGVTLKAKDINGNPAPSEVIYLDDLRVSLSVLPLIIGKKNITYHATLGGGEVEGKAALNKDAELTARAKGVALEAITPLKALGIKGSRLSGTAAFTTSPKGCPRGKANLDVTNIDLKGLKSPLPLLLFGNNTSASLAFATYSDCTAQLKGLFIEGYALNAKIDGIINIKSPIKRSTLTLKAEIFTKPGTKSRGVETLLSAFMNEYKRSPGRYLLNIKGTIGNPSVKR